MKNLVIIGAGTAGTTLANRLLRTLPGGWSLSVIDPEDTHLYQPGLLFVPFGQADSTRLQRARKRTLEPGTNWIRERVRAIDTHAKRIELNSGAQQYDLLVLASGAQLRPEETAGLSGGAWHTEVFDFYTLEGAVALRQALGNFEGGRLVVNVVEMPIKCPVAPLEFLFLADAYFATRRIRERVELVYVTPLDGAFTRPIASRVLGSMLSDRAIAVEADFATSEVDAEGRVIRSYDDREVKYDLLVTVPTHGGAPFVETSGLGNELGFVATDPHTLRVKGVEEVFALGDATDLPSSKAGSVAHFQSEVLAANLNQLMRGRQPTARFDGHANCFVETGFGRAMLIDFNYEVEPLAGRYPWPVVGPFSLLKETRRNHWGKLAFERLYWNRLLPAKRLFVPNQLSMRGKVQQPPAKGKELTT